MHTSVDWNPLLASENLLTTLFFWLWKRASFSVIFLEILHASKTNPKCSWIIYRAPIQLGQRNKVVVVLPMSNELNPNPNQTCWKEIPKVWLLNNNTLRSVWHFEDGHKFLFCMQSCAPLFFKSRWLLNVQINTRYLLSPLCMDRIVFPYEEDHILDGFHLILYASTASHTYTRCYLPIYLYSSTSLKLFSIMVAWH